MADDTELDPDAELERKALLAGDAALYARLVEVGFTGPDFRVVADALARYAYPILYAWLASGQIVQECARKGVGGIRSLAAGEVILTRHDVEDLVQETLLIALSRFRLLPEIARRREGASPRPGRAARGSCTPDRRGPSPRPPSPTPPSEGPAAARRRDSSRDRRR